MIHLNIPFWLFGAIVGTVCCVLLCIALAIGYRVRRLRTRRGHASSIETMAATLLTSHFQQNLMAMQVDAVFDALAALIETERLKLKALVAPAFQTVATAEASRERSALVPESDPSSDRSESLNPDAASAEPEYAFDPAQPSAWSQTELDLAEKMRRLKSGPQRRLEAVA